MKLKARTLKCWMTKVKSTKYTFCTTLPVDNVNFFFGIRQPANCELRHNLKIEIFSIHHTMNWCVNDMFTKMKKKIKKITINN